MRRPPAGKMARRNGRSVCRPTITSLSRSIQPGVVGEQGRRLGRVDVEHALLPLLVEIGLQLRPHGLGPLRRAGEERFVAVVGRHVANDEVANIDRALPAPRREIAPPVRLPQIDGVRCQVVHRISSLSAYGCVRKHGQSPFSGGFVPGSESVMLALLGVGFRNKYLRCTRETPHARPDTSRTPGRRPGNPAVIHLLDAVPPGSTPASTRRRN